MGTLPERSTQVTASTRLSDADRERAVALLNEAVADGRLTWPEHGERVELAWSARTREQLVPSIGDLDAVTRPVEPQRVVATASKIVRRPEPGRRIMARSLFGAVYLDLTEVPNGAELHVEASSFGGKVVITVGPNARVVDEGEAVLAKRKILVAPPETVDGPVIRISGRSTLGHLKVLSRGHRWW